MAGILDPKFTVSFENQCNYGTENTAGECLEDKQNSAYDPWEVNGNMCFSLVLYSVTPCNAIQ